MDRIDVRRESLPPALAETLDVLAPELRRLEGPWWIFGSAAVALLGVQGAGVADLDVLTTPDDARRLLAAFGAAPMAKPGTALFRSEVFGRVDATPVRIEVMAGFHVRRAADWVRVWPSSRVALAWGDATLFTPSAAEHVEIYRLFGRPKDLERAALLERLRGMGG